jgi:hypothetical protein
MLTINHKEVRNMPGATKDGMPVIGDNKMFSGPRDNAPRTPILPGKQKEKIEASLDIIAEMASTKPEEEEKKLSPEEKYEQTLKEFDLTLRDARSIMEKMVTKGFYSEEFKIGPITCVLRTRVYEDLIRTQRLLESERLEYSSSVQEVLNRYNTAASLARYGENIFEHPDPQVSTEIEIEEAFEKRLLFVRRLPQLISVRVMQFSYEFDRKMLAVFGDGAPQDF